MIFLIDFKEELSKFKPAVEVDESEHIDETNDMIELLQYISKQIKSSNKE